MKGKDATEEYPERIPRHWIPAPLEGQRMSIGGVRTVPAPHVRPVWRDLGRWAVATFAPRPWSGSPATARDALLNSAHSMGPIYVETLRAASMRMGQLPRAYDVIAPAATRAMPPIPASHVRWTVERELRCPMEHSFAQFERTPVMTDAYSQTHAAKLTWGGENVLVRVLRPDADSQVRKHLGILRLALRILASVQPGRLLDSKAVLRDAQERLAEETDLRYQARNMRQLRKALLPHGIYVPWVFESHSTKRVCVIEKVEGIGLKQFESWCAHNPRNDWEERSFEWNHLAPRQSGLRLLYGFLDAISGSGTFPEWPDPTGILLLAHGRVCLTGAYRQLSLDPEIRLNTLRRLRAWDSGDLNTLGELSLLNCEQGFLQSADRAVRGIAAIFRRWGQQASVLKRNDPTVWMSAAEHQSIDWVRGLGFVPNIQWMLMLRAWHQLDLCVAPLITAEDRHKMLRAYLRKRDRREDFDGFPLPSPSAPASQTLAEILQNLDEFGYDRRREEVLRSVT